jgi:hypothetical protein
MQRWFNASFARQADCNAFTSWVRAFESDERVSVDVKIRFVRTADCYAVLTVSCDEPQYDAIFNAVGGFNGKAFE